MRHLAMLTMQPLHVLYKRLVRLGRVLHKLFTRRKFAVSNISKKSAPPVEDVQRVQASVAWLAGFAASSLLC